ncbi:hypothetical protein FJ659_12110 [Bacillus dicomae]|uniref:Uncharacterized protein n=1 Tax=Bacillus dicomae TaxID=3088378 RepID=A0AC61T5P2_9BACI|nr:hypothetical protein FJ659_12110 [Bacillus dicomae]
MQKETLLQHVFYDYNTFYHFRSTIWQNKRRIDALPFSKSVQIAVIFSPEDNYILLLHLFNAGIYEITTHFVIFQHLTSPLKKKACKSFPFACFFYPAIYRAVRTRLMKL